MDYAMLSQCTSYYPIARRTLAKVIHHKRQLQALGYSNQDPTRNDQKCSDSLILILSEQLPSWQCQHDNERGKGCQNAMAVCLWRSATNIF